MNALFGRAALFTAIFVSKERHNYENVAERACQLEDRRGAILIC